MFLFINKQTNKQNKSKNKPSKKQSKTRRKLWLMTGEPNKTNQMIKWLVRYFPVFLLYIHLYVYIYVYISMCIKLPANTCVCSVVCFLNNLARVDYFESNLWRHLQSSLKCVLLCKEHKLIWGSCNNHHRHHTDWTCFLNLLLLSIHSSVSMWRSLQENFTWVCPYFCFCSRPILLAFLGWFVRWEASGCTTTVLCVTASRICWKQHTTSLCSSHLAFFFQVVRSYNNSDAAISWEIVILSKIMKSAYLVVVHLVFF